MLTVTVYTKDFHIPQGPKSKGHVFRGVFGRNMFDRFGQSLWIVGREHPHLQHAGNSNSFEQFCLLPGQSKKIFRKFTTAKGNPRWERSRWLTPPVAGDYEANVSIHGYPGNTSTDRYDFLERFRFMIKDKSKGSAFRVAFQGPCHHFPDFFTSHRDAYCGAFYR